MALVVLDVGKTHAKLTLIGENGATIDALSRANVARRAGGLRVLDGDGIESWLKPSLATLSQTAPIEAIVPVGHGAAAAYLDGETLAAPVLDYENAPPEDLLSRYRALRDPFGRTLSPPLPLGLNLGAQLFWQETIHPHLRAERMTILPWPQYWAWRLSGERASEVTSLGCHSDLWFPAERGYSDLAKSQGWDSRFAPLGHADDVLGHVRPELADEMRISRDCKVVCGLHDSNAALVAARGIAALAEGPFTLVSTGTWFVAFASGAGTAALDPARDTLANVDVLGHPVPSARFMGGREYELVVGPDIGARATLSDAERIIASETMTKPSFVEGGGPFPASKGAVFGEIRDSAERAALASLHLALMTHSSLDLIAARGPIVIEGRFASDMVFVSALARLRAPTNVLASAEPDGVARGAARLVYPTIGIATKRIVPLDLDLRAYADAWRACAES